MMKYSMWRGLLCSGVAAMLAGGLAGCTKMIQPDQLAELKQLRAREVELDRSITDLDSRKQRLERELTSRQEEVRRCKDTQAALQARLNAYPGNLGDPLPETPPPPPAPPTQKKGRK